MSTPPVAAEIREQCLCLGLQRAARLVARRYDDAFRPLEITSWQFSLLVSLSTPEPPTIGRIAELLDGDRTTITACLKPLARRGLLKTVVSTRDRRERLVHLTPRGRVLLERALPLWRDAQRLTERELGESPRRLRGELGKLGSMPDRY